MKTTSRPKPETIDGYLAAVPKVQRAALEQLRKTIRAARPAAEECISYGVPAFRLDGKPFVWFAAATTHCALYPGAVLAAFKKELAGYGTSKGTVRFQPDAPLPATLVRKLIKANLARRARPKR